MVRFLKTILKKSFLKTILKKQFIVVFRKKILFGNLNMKNRFLDLFSLNILPTYVQFKSFQSIFIVSIISLNTLQNKSENT